MASKSGRPGVTKYRRDVGSALLLSDRVLTLHVLVEQSTHCGVPGDRPPCGNGDQCVHRTLRYPHVRFSSVGHLAIVGHCPEDAPLRSLSTSGPVRCDDPEQPDGGRCLGELRPASVSMGVAGGAPLRVGQIGPAGWNSPVGRFVIVEGQGLVAHALEDLQVAQHNVGVVRLGLLQLRHPGQHLLIAEVG